MRSFSQQKESGCRRRDAYAMMMMGAASRTRGRTRPTTRRRTRRRGRLSSRRRRRRRRSSLVVSRRRGSGGRRRGRVVSHLGDEDDDDDVLSLKSKTRLFPSSPPRGCVGQKSFFFLRPQRTKTISHNAKDDDGAKTTKNTSGGRTLPRFSRRKRRRSRVCTRKRHNDFCCGEE